VNTQRNAKTQKIHTADEEQKMEGEDNGTPIDLPVELLVHVFSFFTVEDLCNVTLVQTSWSALIYDYQILWKHWYVCDVRLV
jgi:F-box-like